jgi:large subunit ribosomal protein L15
MRLNELRDKDGANKKKIRVGRGIGSGKGKTGGRGVKGQKSRSGVAIKGFEGGQMPIHMRLPKRGFNKPNRAKFAEINIGGLQKAIDAKQIDAKKAIDEAVLVEAGVVRRKTDGIRLLAKGALKAKVQITVAGASKAAVEAVEKAGGSVTIIAPTPAPEAKE